jgi:uncharacterized membrane protein
MEIFIYILITGLLFIWLRNSILSEMGSLAREIKNLRNAISNLETKPPAIEQKPATKPEDIKPVQPVVEIPRVEEEKTEIEQIEEEIIEETFHVKRVYLEEYTPPKSILEEKVNLPPAAKPSFFEKHPDLEKFIGENLINKIGIAILVLGIGFFVKYAIDKNWINEYGRVGIGVLCGGLLIGIAHRLRRRFKAFSSVLVGGGLSVLYFTIAIAFHQYHIFSQESAFIIMVVITGFAVSLSIAYDKMELAVLALIGGFSTPFMVSTGEGNYKVLFTYLLILNCGLLVLAYRKKWNLVNILCYFFTILIYGSWLTTKCLGKPAETSPYLGALLFATTFYVVFFLMNVVYNIRNKISFKAFEAGMLLSNTFLYYGAGMSILFYYYHGQYQGLFTAAMGVVNFGFAYTFYRRQSIDRNLVFLLTGLVLTFISLAAPVQLEGNYITLFWSAEAVLLLWFSQKSGIKLVKIVSLVVNVLMLCSLVMDWGKIYGTAASATLPILLNKGFITNAVALISVFLSMKLLKNEKESFFITREFSLNIYRNILSVVLMAVLYFTFMLELNYHVIRSGYGDDARNIVWGIYNFIFLISAFLFYRKRLSLSLASALLIASGLLISLYLISYNESVISVRENFLEEGTNGIFFYLHFLLASLFVGGLYVSNRSAKEVFNEKDLDWIKWIMVLLVVYICSAELNHVVSWLSYSQGRIIYEINRQVYKAGYTVLWGIISLVLMQQGMRRRDKTLRIISLSLFFITIIKLFASDIKGISEGGKIAAFISLGVLLLIVSFMYQRLKQLILEGEPTEVPIEVKNEDKNLSAE